MRQSNENPGASASPIQTAARRGCASSGALVERPRSSDTKPELARQGLRRTQTWHEILPSRSRGAPFHSMQKSSPPRAKVHVPGSSKTKPPGGLTFASDGTVAIATVSNDNEIDLTIRFEEAPIDIE